ncbi:MAG: LysR family transcriptional regulator [Sutterellaceae bacterium]|nr:LysR family transcriptional regulator [Burkholderiaceae bacterium]MDW8430312.1 LysR family transcriptional regulator [Sutterellaceae bacterium]
MGIEGFDLNLLRVFAAVHALRNVGRAAEALGLSQPAVSHALTRLRLQLRDPLFVRVAGGVAPTARADELAAAVERALSTVQAALAQAERFDPATSGRTFRLHMSDIGEGVFLPRLTQTVRARAPGVRLEVFQLEHDRIADALDRGRIDLAFGYLPTVTETRRVDLFEERYVLLLRSAHPQASLRVNRAMLAKLDYAVVRSHPQTSLLLHRLGLQERVRLVIPHFMALGNILDATDLAAVVPLQVAQMFAARGGFRVLRPDLGTHEFAVGLHWSRRFEHDAANRWLREIALRLFRQTPAGRTA